ncbi:MAG: hypothetical protein AB4062_01705 [Crocosphaera sp.]
MLNFKFNIKSQTDQSKPINLVKKYTRFNYFILGTIFVSLTSISLFNFLVDPYDIFRHNHWWELNLTKPEKPKHDRLYKTIDIIHLKPEIILLGSSRMKQGLNPNHPALSQDKKTYNLGIDGVNTYEIFQFLKHSYVNQPNLEKVILGIDHFMFNEFIKLQDSFAENRLSKTHILPKDLINSLLSEDAINASKITLLENYNAPKKNQNLTYGDNGFFPHRRPQDGQTKWRFRNIIKQYFDFHTQYKLSEEGLNNFKQIVEFCRQNNIELIVFISPSHATQWEALKVTDRWQSFEQWKRKMVDITPVWDFSGYNSITTEPIKEVMTNYVDNSHYTPKIGEFVLNRILSYDVNQVPQDFGILMTPENIDNHLAKIRGDREKWAENQPNEVQLVETIKRNIKPK